MNQNKLLALLTALFAALMSIPYIVPHTGALALVALVPLLCMERIATLGGVRRIWLWLYSAFVLWNAFTTFWVCNATIGGGIFAILANSLQMLVIFIAFRASRRVFRGSLPYIFMMVMWIAWERLYYDAQISWPWLALGNSLAGSVSLCQWYEFTGTTGGSLWIWLCNLGIFGLMVSLSDGRWQSLTSRGKGIIAGLLSLVIVGPIVASKIIYANYEETDDEMQVTVVQPNIDPYNKFGGLRQDQQNAIFLDLAERGLKAEASKGRHPHLLLAPETFTCDIWLGEEASSQTFRRFNSFLQDWPDVTLVFGASDHEVIYSETRPDPLARDRGNGSWVMSHNSAIATDSTGRFEIFHKSKLVVGVEMTPWPKLFTKIDDMLGGVMGRCKGQDEISVLHCNRYERGQTVESVEIGVPICYESIYGEYCTGYVKAGAQVLAVITNDAWWGNTPGYRQHLRYASLRAIETRRDIARCANTGISAIINQRGDIIKRTEWWQPAVLNGSINLNSAETVFVRNGDIAGRICCFVCALLLLAFGARMIMQIKMRKDLERAAGTRQEQKGQNKKKNRKK